MRKLASSLRRRRVALPSITVAIAVLLFVGGSIAFAASTAQAQAGQRLFLRGHQSSAANRAAMYTLRDLGAPPQYGSDPEAQPVAFNDAGQILGWATLPNAIHCLVYDRGAFVDVTPVEFRAVCNPTALSQADWAGNAFFSGALNIAGDTPLTPFIGKIRTRSAATSVYPFVADGGYYAGIWGINRWGEALGQASVPPGSFFTTVPAFVVPAGTHDFVIAQPHCTKLARYCAVPSAGGTCPFGGCVINDRGRILAVDAYNGRYMTFLYGDRHSERDLPFTPTNTATVQLNDADSVAYLYIDPVTFAQRAFVYSLHTGKTTELPSFIPHCQVYANLSFNDRNQILGITTSPCPDSLWIWDSKTGGRDITAQLPVTSDALSPIAMNDDGRILVELITPRGRVPLGDPRPAALTAVNAQGGSSGIRGQRTFASSPGKATERSIHDSPARRFGGSPDRTLLHGEINLMSSARACFRLEPRNGVTRKLRRALIAGMYVASAIAALNGIARADSGISGRPKPPALRAWGRGHVAASAQYTIIDVGARSSTLYEPSAPPFAFNDSGQIIGNASR